jgi:hypothetical protein
MMRDFDCPLYSPVGSDTAPHATFATATNNGNDMSERRSTRDVRIDTSSTTKRSRG